MSNTIYQYNNQQNYKKSQDTLLNLLEQENIIPRDKIEINILLSYTHKRLQDYTFVKYYLSQANTIARENNLTELYNKISVQFAFAYFDTQDYSKAAKIMEKISSDDYRNISTEDKAKIIMQEGYIYYTHKDFVNADIYYEKAALLMQKSSSCDLPIIYGKKIQLYFSLNNLDKAAQYYNLGIRKAKNCKIMKYEIYLAEVMMNFYKEKKDPVNALKFTNKYDSLSKIYRASENLQKLHLDRNLKVHKTEQEVKKFSMISTVIYLLAILILCVIIYFIVKYAIRVRKNNIAYLSEIESMKQILLNHHQEKNQSAEIKLNNKQLMIISMIKNGKTNKEIGKEFNITESTVKYHIKNIYETLNIKTRKDLNDII
ncbi:LuxR C-terminal-related transcriptional regulator [Chryseobacterium sp. GP-SGM7]|uniref:LuxR C-terminal-related transcriptional regulator n=1 Tax=Chryseobacterium sp. GP-SGM7 TaxID=3411323 RepID=UPI003B94274E